MSQKRSTFAACDEIEDRRVYQGATIECLYACGVDAGGAQKVTAEISRKDEGMRGKLAIYVKKV